MVCTKNMKSVKARKLSQFEFPNDDMCIVTVRDFRKDAALGLVGQATGLSPVYVTSPTHESYHSAASGVYVIQDGAVYAPVCFSSSFAHRSWDLYLFCFGVGTVVVWGVRWVCRRWLCCFNGGSFNVAIVVVDYKLPTCVRTVSRNTPTSSHYDIFFTSWGSVQTRWSGIHWPVW